jgi:cold-inducible RNA-binding protein
MNIPPQHNVNTRLYVGNLSAAVTEIALRSLFSKQGEVADVQLVIESSVGRSRGFAYVNMETPEGANLAIKLLHHHALGGRYITVNPARETVKPRRGTLIGDNDFRGFSRRM